MSFSNNPPMPQAKRILTSVVACLILITGLLIALRDHEGSPRPERAAQRGSVPPSQAATPRLITLRDLPRRSSAGQSFSIAFSCPGYNRYQESALVNLESPVFYTPFGIVQEKAARFNSEQTAQKIFSLLKSPKSLRCLIDQTLPLAPLALGVTPIGKPSFKLLHESKFEASVITHRVSVPVTRERQRTKLYLYNVLAQRAQNLYLLAFAAIGKRIPAHFSINVIEAAIE